MFTEESQWSRILKKKLSLRDDSFIDFSCNIKIDLAPPGLFVYLSGWALVSFTILLSSEIKKKKNLSLVKVKDFGFLDLVTDWGVIVPARTGTLILS